MMSGFGHTNIQKFYIYHHLTSQQKTQVQTPKQINQTLRSSNSRLRHQNASAVVCLQLKRPHGNFWAPGKMHYMQKRLWFGTSTQCLPQHSPDVTRSSYIPTAISTLLTCACAHLAQPSDNLGQLWRPSWNSLPASYDCAKSPVCIFSQGPSPTLGSTCCSSSHFMIKNTEPQSCQLLLYTPTFPLSRERPT